MATFQGMYNDLRCTGFFASPSPSPFLFHPTTLPMETIHEVPEGDSVSHGRPPSLSRPKVEFQAVPVHVENQNADSVKDNATVEDNQSDKFQSNKSRNKIKEQLGKRLNVRFQTINKKCSSAPLSAPYAFGRRQSFPATLFSKRHTTRQLNVSKVEPNGRDEIEERTITLDTRDDEPEDTTIEEIHYIIRRGGSLPPDVLRDENSSKIEVIHYKKPIRQALSFSKGLFRKKRQPEEEEIHYIIRREASVSTDYKNPATLKEIIASLVSLKQTLSLKDINEPAITKSKGLLQQEARDDHVQSAKARYDIASTHSQSQKDSCREIIVHSPIELKCGDVFRRRWKRLKGFGKHKRSSEENGQKSLSFCMSRKSFVDSHQASGSQLSGSRVVNIVGLDASSVVSHLSSLTGFTGLYGKHEEYGRTICIYRGDTCQTLAGTFDEANQCFWHMMTVDPLLYKDDDMGKDSQSTSMSFMPSVESTTEDEDSSQGISFVKHIRPNAKAWDDWRLTSRSFQPSPAFRLLKNFDFGSIESEATVPAIVPATVKTGVSKPSFSPLEPTNAFDEGTVSRLWAVDEADEDEETLTNATEKSRQHHRRRGPGDTIFSFFGLK